MNPKISKIVEKIHRFFWETFQLDGLDGSGKMAPIFIDWNQDNASWSCRSKVGAKEVSCSFQFHNKHIEPDVVAHEWTHAIIGHLAPLRRGGQPGALNESLADIFGLVFKSWVTGKPEWQIVDRDVRQRPAHFRKSSKAHGPENDFGYVHENSLIPSHAFYRVVQSMRRPNKMEIIAKIWFKALTQMRPHETFVNFARKTIRVAQNFYPDNRAQNDRLVQMITDSWNYVFRECMSNAG